MKFENSNLQWALKYCSMKWPIMAVDSMAHRLYSKQRPFRSQSEWPMHGTTDPAIVTGWFLKAPFANIALPTGTQSGLIGIRASGATGQATLDRWMANHDWFPETSSIQSEDTTILLYGSEGLVLPPSLEIGPGVVAHDEGALVWLPPSKDDEIHYGWDDPDDLGVAPGPKWLINLLSKTLEVAA